MNNKWVLNIEYQLFPLYIYSYVSTSDTELNLCLVQSFWMYFFQWRKWNLIWVFWWYKTYLQKEYISNIIQLSKRKSEYYQVFVKLNLSVKSNSNISFCATTSSLWRLEAPLIPYLLLSLVSLLFTTPFSSLTPFKDISRILLSKSNHHIEIYWITYSRRKQC